MIITLGFVREAFYMAKVSNQLLKIEIKPDCWNNLTLSLSPEGMAYFHYNNFAIWKEDVSGDFFGIESLDAISRIIACIDNKDSAWNSKYPSPEKLN